MVITGKPRADSHRSSVTVIRNGLGTLDKNGNEIKVVLVSSEGEISFSEKRVNAVKWEKVTPLQYKLISNTDELSNGIYRYKVTAGHYGKYTITARSVDAVIGTPVILDFKSDEVSVDSGFFTIVPIDKIYEGKSIKILLGPKASGGSNNGGIIPDDISDRLYFYDRNIDSGSQKIYERPQKTYISGDGFRYSLSYIPHGFGKHSISVYFKSTVDNKLHNLSMFSGTKLPPITYYYHPHEKPDLEHATVTVIRDNASADDPKGNEILIYFPLNDGTIDPCTSHIGFKVLFNKIQHINAKFISSQTDLCGGGYRYQINAKKGIYAIQVEYDNEGFGQKLQDNIWTSCISLEFK